MNVAPLPSESSTISRQSFAAGQPATVEFVDTTIMSTTCNVENDQTARQIGALEEELQQQIEAPPPTTHKVFPTIFPIKHFDLNARVVSETSLHLAIGPMEQLGIFPERGGPGWRCAIALIFVLNRGRRTNEPPVAKAFLASIDFIGEDAEIQRRNWIADQRNKGRSVLKLPSQQAVVALDRAGGEMLCQYGILSMKSGC